MIAFDFSHYKNKHWYPGHMLKANKQIIANLSLVRLAIILYDARLPRTSYNPTLEQTLKDKTCLHIINKCDMISLSTKKKWQVYFKERQKITFFTQLNKPPNQQVLLRLIRSQTSKHREQKTRSHSKPIRAMILGVPNTGKSTLINCLKQSKITKTASFPGVTKSQQWVRLKNNIELLDTPGVMHPKGTGSKQELNLGLANIIKRKIIGEQILCEYLLYLMHLYNEQRAFDIYGLETLPRGIDILLNQVCKKRGFLASGGRYDWYKATLTILHDYDRNRFPKIPLELPEQLPSSNDTVLAHF